MLVAENVPGLRRVNGHAFLEEILGEFAEYLDHPDGNANKKKDDLTIIVVEVQKSA